MIIYGLIGLAALVLSGCSNYGNNQPGPKQDAGPDSQTPVGPAEPPYVPVVEAPDTRPEIAIVNPDAGVNEASPALDSYAALDGGFLADASLPPGFGPNSCPPYGSPEEKAFVLWPRLASINDVPINTSPPNTVYFKPLPILLDRARQGLSSMWNVLAAAGNEHWFDGNQRKGVMLFDIAAFYLESRQGLGLEAYPYSAFMPDPGSPLGYFTGSGFGDLGSACNLGVHIFYRLLHAPYRYDKVLAHEYIHWFGDQWRSGAPGGVDLNNSIDFTPVPPADKNNQCLPGTLYGLSNAEENRAEYVAYALFFPSSRSILAEADQLLGCDPSITTARDTMYQQIYKYYFNGLIPPAESASAQNWLKVSLFNMRGLQKEALAGARIFIENNPNDYTGTKSIFYDLFSYTNETSIQFLPDIPYQGGIYSGYLQEVVFPDEYTALLGQIINDPVTPGGVPYDEEVIRYSLWYKALSAAYPKDTIWFLPAAASQYQSYIVYSESDLAAAKSTLQALTARLAQTNHPLTGEISLLNDLIDYWAANKPLKTADGFIKLPSGELLVP